MKTAIIIGTSRANGNTSQLARYVASKVCADYFNLADYKIEPFDYDNNYHDDFSSLIKKLLSYEQLIFATPMYWYSASAQMKLFLDRLSDLLSFEQDQGRLLRGKTVALLATGADTQPPECFEQMFSLTFAYLGMNYKGMAYCSSPNTLNLATQQDNIDTLINAL